MCFVNKKKHMVKQSRSSKRKTNYKNSKNRIGSIQLLPKTINQSYYIDNLKDYKQNIVLGCAGTGKTYITATYACKLFLDKDIDKIIITRPNVSSGRSIGFFPGDLNEKMAPWAQPIIEVIEKHIGKNAYQCALKKGNIEIVPFEVMRGRSFDNAFIILDEAQNCTLHEIKMFITRVGENSRVVMNGDISQTDLKNSSGLSTIIDLSRKYNINCAVTEFGLDDIVRSDITKEWIVAFTEENL